MTRPVRLLLFLLAGAAALVVPFPARAGQFEEAHLYIEYNSTDNDLGFHVFLDAEDWKSMRIAISATLA
jgi:hypothetical protein